MFGRLRALPAAILLALAALLAAAAVVAVVLRALDGPPRVELPADAQAIAADPDRYSKPLGAALEIEPANEDPAYLDAFLRTFTSMTPENAMKWEVVHPAPGRWDFGRADALLDVAEATGKRVRGHPLVWDQQVPSWAGAGDVERTLRDHVTRLVRRYRGRVAQWDAVNEPLEDDGSLTRNVWHRALGERYIDVAFAAARAADPEAALFLNEIGAERGRKLRGLVRLVRRLKRRGVPIDGVGLQGHTDSEDFPREREFARAFAAFAALGLDVEVTELDVEGGSPAAFGAAARACAAARNCTGVTVWGVTDAHSWLGAEAQALPFDASGRPKPALRALTAPLRSDASR